MEQDTVIKVDGLYKKFSTSLRRGLLYGAVDLSRNFLGQKAYDEKLRKSEFWALQDINFELKKGETLGIIGVNGSGKSTLLRLLTGIFPPDRGSIEIKGRVGALIAVGAGFHPHMTGRENVYLNGTILGMSAEQLKRKFDDIVEFAEIGEFLDAPVSTYSSGMRVRLGFAIAVFVEPEILLVDEVLSVGDITFQKKATEKIQQLKENSSTMFVSHSLRHVYRICDRVILLDKGKIEKEGTPDEVITFYVNKNIKENVNSSEGNKVLEGIPEIVGVDVRFANATGEETRSVRYGEQLSIKSTITSEADLKDALCSITLFSTDGNPVTTANAEGTPFDIDKGDNTLTVTFPKLHIMPGVYNVKVKFAMRLGGLIVEIDAGMLEVLEIPGLMLPKFGYYREEAVWNIKN